MKLKNVLIIAMAIITLGLVVACSDDVVVTTKDNSQDYTQVLESNGAFVYNGKKYDSLKLVLKDIELGKGDAVDPKVIKVTKNVKDKAATIGEGLDIVLDLGGHTLTFYDVKDNGLTVGAGSNLQVKNGTLALQDKSKADYAVVGTNGAASLVFDGVTIDAAGQKTIDATDVDIVSLSNGSSVTGATILTNVRGTVEGDGFSAANGTKVEGTLVASEGSVLYINNDMGAGVSLNNSNIIVTGTGHAILSSVSGDNEIIAYDESAITNNTGTVLPTVTAICYIDRETRTYYGDLKGALDSLDRDGRKIVFFADETHIYSSSLSPNNNYSVTIDLAGYDVNVTSATNITSSGAVTLMSSVEAEAVFKGSITGTGTASGTVVTVENVTVNGNVTSTCSVSIIGSNVGDSSALVDVYAPVVTVTGSKIYANTISADGTMVNPATSVSITDSVGLIKCIYAKATNSTDTAITLSSSTSIPGSVDLMIGDYTHNDSTEDLEKTNVLIASKGNVRIVKNEKAVKVYENIVVSDGNLTTEGIIVYGTVDVTGNMTDGETVGSTFGKAITVTGAGNFKESVFKPNDNQDSDIGISANTVSIKDATFNKADSYDYFFYVKTSGSDSVSGESIVSPLTIEGSNGRTASITSLGGSIKIDNSSISTEGKNLRTGAVTAKASSSTTYYNVFVYGPAANSSLTIDSVKFAKGVTSARVIFGTVGSLEGDYVETLTDGTAETEDNLTTYANGSTFNDAIKTTGDVILRASTTKADITTDTSVVAYAATLGNGEDDDIYAPSVSITDSSKMKLGNIKKNVDTYATSVVIDSPALYASETSSILGIYTGSLTAAGTNANLTVTSANATGATSISGCTFNSTVLSGETSITGGMFANGNGTTSTDHSFTGKTTISGGVFTGDVVLSNTAANSISGDVVFNDSSNYGSFTYSGTGTLDISGGYLTGITTFSGGTTTITGGNIGSSWSNITLINTGSIVYVDHCDNMHLANGCNGVSVFKTGNVTVYGRGGLEYFGSNILQTANTEILTVTTSTETGHTFTLDADAYVSSAFLNLSFVFNVSGENNSIWISSNTGNLSASGSYNSSSGDGRLKISQGMNPSGIAATVRYATY